jgi:predicted 3-demethylubiquinone-9 3-methyltransferase (glyoxalase superfamily)
MQTISPCLWFIEKAEEAARFYVSIFPDSRIDRVSTSPATTPAGPPGSIVMVDFTLFGRPFFCFGAARQDPPHADGHDPFNNAISLMVTCDTQQEIDRHWDALLQGGGQAVQCGWLKDRYGVSWQITPRALLDMVADPDRAKAKRAMEAMMAMVKLDIAALRRAFDGG